MEYTMYLTNEQAKNLELEVVSASLKVHLTRVLHKKIASNSEGEYENNYLINRQNYLINKSLNIQKLPIYRLEDSIGDGYHSAEYAWHNGEFELLFRRLNTPQLVEYLGDLIWEDYFAAREINELLKKDGVSFKFVSLRGKISVEVFKIEDIERNIQELDALAPTAEPHQNIRLLFSRAETSLTNSDHPGLIHSCACIFETLAKDIVNTPNVQNETLGGFFARYRNDSSLPAPVLDYILDTYRLRNSAPLSGHGSTQTPPNLTAQQAIALIEMTRAFVRTEYRMLSAANARV